MSIQGLMVPLVTPRNDGRLDSQGLRSLLEFHLERCADSLFIIGTTGEFQYLSLEEKKKVIQVTSETIDRQCSVLVGVSSQNTDDTVSIIKEAEEQKLQMIVLAPMYGPEKPDYIIDGVLGNSSLPVLLYNNPQIHDGKSLPVQIVEKYSEHPQVIGIKDSSGDWDYFSQLLGMQRQGFSVLQGRESHILQSIQAGADGIVAGAANVNPDPFCDIIYSADEEIMQEILNLKKELDTLSAESIPALKMKLANMGIIRSAELFG